jgi:hypothetical protein
MLTAVSDIEESPFRTPHPGRFLPPNVEIPGAQSRLLNPIGSSTESAIVEIRR